VSIENSATVEQIPERLTSPRGRRRPGLLHKVNGFLTSPKLAIALLVVVLACCVFGVTVVRGARAGEVIFATLWFNALLVLLAISSATAFFTRVWKRKLTLVQAGMIVFHLSFVGVLGGVVYNGLFSFEGVLRLTEGETLPNGQPDSYDEVHHGRFFEFSRLRGETTLVKMHRNYQVDGGNKRAAYEVAVGEGDAAKRSIIYVTEYLDVDGVRYFCLKEGYSVLLVMLDGQGREIFGAHVPLQSFKRDDGGFEYASGTASGAAPFGFPPPPDHTRADIQMSYRPNTVVERQGDVGLQVMPVAATGAAASEKAGQVPVGGRFDAGGFVLEPREIRYWVGMSVRYDPGQNVVLASLCAGLVGMVLTFAGRVRQGSAVKRAA
jgi:hypothetical protein